MLESEDFPEDALFVGDAGFVDYGLWRKFLDCGHQFLVRVGTNVTLIRGLGYQYEKGWKGLVYCWPKNAMNKNQPPLTLRLIRCLIGNKTVCLLTSVLDKNDLSDARRGGCI